MSQQAADTDSTEQDSAEDSPAVAEGDRVRAMRAIDTNWTKSVVGEVVVRLGDNAIADEPVITVDDADDGPILVRESNVEEVLERAG